MFKNLLVFVSTALVGFGSLEARADSNDAEQDFALHCTHVDSRGSGATLSIARGAKVGEVVLIENGLAHAPRKIRESSFVEVLPAIYKYGFTFAESGQSLAIVLDMNELKSFVKTDAPIEAQYDECYQGNTAEELVGYAKTLKALVSGR